MTRKVRTGASALAIAIIGCGATIASAGEAYRWVQYVPGGLEARAISLNGACPKAIVDGAAVTMKIRSAAGPGYPITTCATPIPSVAKSVTVDGYPMPLPKARPERILIIGDTGCRLKGEQIQACNDMSEWPFRLGAAMSADFKPDLVLHVGDLHYRESECPVGNLGCAGTPFGDTWDVWRADFFTPGEPLLNAAPWIFVRGNHEECERGGMGWARTLDPYPFQVESGKSGCLGPTKPFKVDIGGVSIVIMDVSSASEKVNEKQVAWYREQFEMAKDIEGPVWLAFHRPVWATDDQKGGIATGDNKTLAAAARGHVPANVQAFVSGHHHTFEVMSYVEDLPVQIVSGHGGDDLSPNAPAVVSGLVVNGVTVKAGIGRPGVFGFSMIERPAEDTSRSLWTLTGYDTHGKPLAKCKIESRNVECN